jgi:mRNA-degrading endonuclease RelE of RelBE toxin-antitoxin system
MAAMRYVRTERFKRAAARLPREIQAKAVKAFMLFKENPRHPSLGVKRVQGIAGVWEGRIDANYRFTFHYEGDACVFRNIGPHAIVEREP